MFHFKNFFLNRFLGFLNSVLKHDFCYQVARIMIRARQIPVLLHRTNWMFP